jgi:hypothetical protein
MAAYAATRMYATLYNECGGMAITARYYQMDGRQQLDIFAPLAGRCVCAGTFSLPAAKASQAVGAYYYIYNNVRVRIWGEFPLPAILYAFYSADSDNAT